MTDRSNESFKRKVSAWDLVWVGVGSIIGSGWLFASDKVAILAGPSGVLSWVIGGIALLLLGLVYAELGAALPQAGGLVRYPYYTHGPIASYMTSIVSVIAFSSIISIEVLAVRQYASGWWPALSVTGSTSPSVLGWCIQLALILIFFLLNYWSVGVFAKANTIITWFKFVVPTIIVVVLLSHLHPANFTTPTFAPDGMAGVASAVASGGVMFAYLGLTPLIALAGEVRNPQRSLPLALIGTTIASTLLYLLLQLAFVGAVPNTLVGMGGWTEVGKLFSLPYYDIALSMGFTWLAVLVSVDAFISPSGASNIYMSTTPRLIYGWARTGTFFRLFRRVDQHTGIPRPALWLTLALAVFWTLPFPSWNALVDVVSSALIFSYSLAPISAHALRLSNPELPRPFFLKGMYVIGPISFVIASLILYWVGWQTLSWLLGLLAVLFIAYVVFGRRISTGELTLRAQVRGALWLLFYYLAIMLVSALGTFGGHGWLSSPWDQLTVVVVALITYYWAVYPARLARPLALTEPSTGQSGTGHTSALRGSGANPRRASADRA